MRRGNERGMSSEFCASLQYLQKSSFLQVKS
eukprot:UN19919